MRLPPMSSMALDLAGEGELAVTDGPTCNSGLISPICEQGDQRRPSRIEMLMSHEKNVKQLPIIQSPMNMGSPVMKKDESRQKFVGPGRSPQPQRVNQGIIKSEISKKVARRSITQLQGEDSNAPVLSLCSPASPISRDAIHLITFTSPKRANEPESRVANNLQFKTEEPSMTQQKVLES